MIAFTHSLEYFRVKVVRWIRYSALEIVEVSMKNLLKQLSRSCTTPRINISLLVRCIPFIILTTSLSALSEEQIVSISAESDRFYASEKFNAIVSYETSDKGLATGIGIRIHFDSSQLSIDSVGSILRQGKVGTQIKQDSDDFDDDPSTDKYLNAGWADVNGSWPELSSQPLELLTLNVITSEDFNGSEFNITISSTDVNYAASAGNLTIRLAR